jgi:fibronectin type 3 domain-containing protein
MRRMRLTVILLGLLASAPFCLAQREATASVAAAIPPLPPPNLRITLSPRGEAVLFWKPSSLESVVAYKVYRKQGGGAFKFLQEVHTPTFIDKHVPTGDVEYAVTAVDIRSGESKLSKPAKNPDPK